MENKYQVKIDDSVMPELYTFDQLIDEGLLDEVDEKIKIRLNGEDVWQTARNYPFASREANTGQQLYSTKGLHGAHQSNNSELDNIQLNISSQHSSYERHNRNVQQNMPELPSIVDKWNWGAFCFSWIWGIFNGLYWPLVIIVFNFIPYCGIIISICICFFLGKRGNKYAWRVANNNGISKKHFKDTQDKWNLFGMYVFSFLLFVVLILFILNCI